MTLEDFDVPSEDVVVLTDSGHLGAAGWTIETVCHGQNRGDDAAAVRSGARLDVEVKGAGN